MNFKKLEFTNDAGQRLAARIDLPDNAQPVAYALFAHCFTCSKNIKAAAHISRALTAERIAVFRFDFTGLGESEGDFGDTNFSSNVDDLVAAAQFMDAGPRCRCSESTVTVKQYGPLVMLTSSPGLMVREGLTRC